MIGLPGIHEPGFIGKIPVRNVWLLLFYASRLYRELPQQRRVEIEKAPDEIPHLVAEILVNAAERRLRRNLSHGYQRRRADLGRVRGRVDFSRTERRMLQRRGRIACEFEALTVDTPRNRFVKAALEKTASHLDRTNGHNGLAGRCRQLALRLLRAGVTGSLEARFVDAAARDSTGWMDAQERGLLSAARLAWSLYIPTEQAGEELLPLPDLVRVPGWRLYELAVYGFYEANLGRLGWRVRHGQHVRWPATEKSPGLDYILPKMIPDVLLEQDSGEESAPARRIVIDAKFQAILQGRVSGKGSLKSANIYQIYAYLRSQERDEDPVTRDSAGVLLHPSLGIDLFESGVIQRHRLTFATVDLAADSETIRSQLLRVVA